MDAHARAESMLKEQRAKADRVLGGLTVALFPVAIALAAVHGAWLVALIGGGIISGGTLAVVRARPGTLLSRLVVSAALMCYAGLTIQELHGMTEMHFGVFVGLAFLTIYRDWRAPVFAGAVIAVHHVLFHALQLAGVGVWVFDGSMSMMGLRGWGMVGLHATFVVLEVGVLIYVARSLELDTRAQARMLAEQEHERDVLVMLAARLESKDLSVVGAVDDGDADGAIVSLSHGIRNVADLVSKISQTAMNVASASDQVAATTSETDRATNEVAGALTHLAEGAEAQVSAISSARQLVEDVSEVVRASADSALRAAEATTHVREAAEQGAASAAEAAAAAQAVTSVSSETRIAISELAVKSQQIDEIVETITGIAGQTNLLALNAAIEAARAGESGRGFAVVADEVRKLAEESQAAAATISNIVVQIQSETQRAVELVEESADRSTTSAQTAQQTRHAFEQITSGVEEMSDQAAQIAEATNRIADGASRMREDMESVASVAEEASASSQQASAATQQTAASSQQVAVSAQMLSDSARELQALVDTFTLSGSSE